MHPLRLSALALLFGTMATAATAGCAAEAPAEDEAASSSAEAYTASLMPQEVNRRVASCFAHDWAGERFTVRSDPRYARSPLLGAIGHVSLALFSSYGYLLMIGSEGERVLSQLERDVKQIANDQDLLPHERAMVVSCVTSQLITYSFNAMSKFMGTAAAAGNYQGICSEYARIAARLMKAGDLEAGLQIGKQDGDAHAWNWVSLNGKEVWMDPQRNPLRTASYSGFFIDPTGQAEAGRIARTCRAHGTDCADPSECCSGARSAKGTCAPTPCESDGVGLCTKSDTACRSIGGAVASKSCGASVDGSVCCTLPSASGR